MKLENCELKEIVLSCEECNFCKLNNETKPNTIFYLDEIKVNEFVAIKFLSERQINRVIDLQYDSFKGIKTHKTRHSMNELYTNVTLVFY